MNTISAKYFLAANSAQGFYNEFSSCYLPFDGWKAYIIKGGPGTGKSSFMREVLKVGEEQGLLAEVVYCTGDPDSLDAVIFPEIKKVVLDGTAPHIIDPVLPGVADKILAFGEFWDEKKFSEPESLKISFEQNKLLHNIARNYICAAGGICQAILTKVQGKFNLKEAENYGKILCDKYLPNSSKNAIEKTRFLGGVTPKGVKYFTDNAINRLKKVVVINDEYGVAANCILKTVKMLALNRGFDLVSYKNPILPCDLIDAVEVPECSLFIVREYCLNKCENVPDKVFAEQFYKILDYPVTSQDLCLLQETLNIASITLNRAKQVHDEMEKHYIKAMDFEKLKAFCEPVINEIFNV